MLEFTEDSNWIREENKLGEHVLPCFWEFRKHRVCGIFKKRGWIDVNDIYTFCVVVEHEEAHTITRIFKVQRGGDVRERNEWGGYGE